MIRAHHYGREKTSGTSRALRDDAIVVDGLRVAYGGRPALADLRLHVPRRRTTALIGPSGCGKSSLLTALCRLSDLIPGCRVAGSVRLDGAELLDPGVDTMALRRRVGFIAQQPNPLPMSIRKNLHFPLREHGLRDRHELAARSERALRAVGLWDEVKDRLQRNAATLSGGQQQRLCIARALSLEPQVLLMDEPCSALDPIAAGVVEDLIHELSGSHTLVVVTHNLAQARRVSDHCACFWYRDGAGTIVEEGATEALFDEPRDEATRAYVRGRRG